MLQRGRREEEEKSTEKRIMEEKKGESVLKMHDPLVNPLRDPLQDLQKNLLYLPKCI